MNVHSGDTSLKNARFASVRTGDRPGQARIASQTHRSASFQSALVERLFDSTQLRITPMNAPITMPISRLGVAGLELAARLRGDR